MGSEHQTCPDFEWCKLSSYRMVQISDTTWNANSLVQNHLKTGCFGCHLGLYHSKTGWQVEVLNYFYSHHMTLTGLDSRTQTCKQEGTCPPSQEKPDLNRAMPFEYRTFIGHLNSRQVKVLYSDVRYSDPQKLLVFGFSTSQNLPFCSLRSKAKQRNRKIIWLNFWNLKNLAEVLGCRHPSFFLGFPPTLQHVRPPLPCSSPIRMSKLQKWHQISRLSG